MSVKLPIFAIDINQGFLEAKTTTITHYYIYRKLIQLFNTFRFKPKTSL
jgi:hypothetical protein